MRAAAKDDAELDDAELLGRIASNDERAFAALVDRYQHRFYSVARRMLGSDHDSEDAVQLTFLNVFRNARTYRDEWRGSTWLYRILTNVCIDTCRKRRHEASESIPASLASDGPRLSGAERMDLEAALVRLPTEARAILLLRYMEDLSYDEIARVRGVTVNTVKTQLKRTKAAMRSYLAPEVRR